MKRGLRGLMPIALIASFVVGLPYIAYLIWQVERKVHYKFGYRDMVQETVREMVKKDALK